VRSPVVTIPIHKASGDTVAPAQDALAVEEPLQIRVNGRDVAVAMRTPGHDSELAAGFLFSEGILHQRADVTAVHCGENTVDLTLAEGVAIPEPRNFYATSSCGVCGKASVDSLRAAGCSIITNAGPVSRQVIHGLPETLRASQNAFEHTGGLHGAALFDFHGALQSVREDVGRHNAVDKLIGAAFFENTLPLSARILMLSGRASFELLQKAAMAGIPVVAAVGAPSSLAVETARRFGIALAGFVRQGRFNIYTAPDRFRA